MSCRPTRSRCATSTTNARLRALTLGYARHSHRVHDDSAASARAYVGASRYNNDLQFLRSLLDDDAPGVANTNLKHMIGDGPSPPSSHTLPSQSVFEEG